jgi:non-heme chloroperoxidase
MASPPKVLGAASWIMSALLWAGCSSAKPRVVARPMRPSAAFQSGFFTTSDGVRLHYLEAGRGASLVFVPGWTMPAEIWEHQIRFFSRQYHVIALDPRSQGVSGQASEGHHPQRRAQDIFELVRHLRLAPAVLVGWSLGVSELLTYVDDFGTSTIQGLVLIDGFVGSDPKANADPWVNDWLADLQRNRKSFTEKFVRGMFRKRYPEAYYIAIVSASLKTPTNTAFTLIGNYYVADVDQRPILQKLDRPLLFVASTQEDQAEMVKRFAPDAHVAVFSEAGHALFVDEAQRFNGLLQEFLITIAGTRLGVPLAPKAN